MSQRFSYVKYDGLSIAKQEAFKKMFEAIESYAEGALYECREKALLMTALEEAYMWTGKAIRDEQISRNNQNQCGNVEAGRIIDVNEQHRRDRG